jgi:cob(I)alamin adenosyltransferase
MKVYTKTGDKGETSLVGGCRVPKDDVRVEAYGTVDELCAHVAYLYDKLEPFCRDGKWAAATREDLQKVMDSLMTASALFACEPAKRAGLPQIKPADIDYLERAIDEIGVTLPVTRYFTLSCGHPIVSMCHICRTVCRRAERAAVRASHEYDIDPQALMYLNRLSDYLYVLARSFAQHLGMEEKYWIPED